MLVHVDPNCLSRLDADLAKFNVAASRVLLRATGHSLGGALVPRSRKSCAVSVLEVIHGKGVSGMWLEPVGQAMLACRDLSCVRLKSHPETSSGHLVRSPQAWT